MLKLMSNVSNGVRSYNGLATDAASLPVNPPMPEDPTEEELKAYKDARKAQQGDDALLYNVSTEKLEYWIFDEENNVWRKA